MVKQFLLSKKEKLVKKFKKEPNLDDIDKLIGKINEYIKNNKFDDAEKTYSEIMQIYKGLSEESKQQIIDRCLEAHKKIENRDSNAENKAAPKALNQMSDMDKLKASISDGINQLSEKKENVVVENIQYVKAMVPGFDELIDKGIPKGSQILVSGGPGSGKTTFSSQLLMNNASKGKRCLYMSFEESEYRLKRHLKQYGWDPDKLLKEGNLVIKRYDPFLISRSVEALLAEARGELVIEIDKTKGLIPENFKPEIVVVDSLSAIAAAFAEKEEAYRIYIEQLFRSFEKMGVTSFLITECEEGTKKFSKTGVEEFLADGVIVFYNMQKGNIRIPAVEVVKMRGVGHKKKIVPFNFIPGQGIEVYPLQDIFIE